MVLIAQTSTKDCLDGGDGRGSSRRSCCASRDRAQASQPPRETASGGARRRRANGRNERDVARVLRFPTEVGANRAAHGQYDLGCNRLRENATRQVLEHLALEAVVIGRMRGAAGYVGSIEMMARLFDGDIAGVMPAIPIVMMRRGRERDPWQRTERRPREREERVARNQ